MIENDGTNIVPGGWTFNASLPINGTYTFASQPQQALYPGDKIAYTLSFAGTNQATAYPSYNYGTTNPYGYGYSNTAAYSTGGYACNGYVCNNNNVVNTTYPTYPYSNYGYGNQYQTATITITADPQNLVPEYNKGNKHRANHHSPLLIRNNRKTKNSPIGGGFFVFRNNAIVSPDRQLEKERMI